VFHNAERSVEDSPNGIFLKGNQDQLRPLNVKVDFEDRGAIVVAKLVGEFQSVESAEADRKSIRKVNATLECACERK
jgi:hypothetical protein